MSTINNTQDEIIEEFAVFDDWMDKYSYIIELGNGLQPLDEKYKTPANLIEGCQSRVWVQADYEDGKIRFSAESDAVIVKGIVALLLRVLSNRSPQEILDADLYFVEKIGAKRTSVVHSFQRLGVDDKANEALCHSFQGEGKRSVTPENHPHFRKSKQKY